ncbi:polysaccharide pyruvyl transferase family protein [Helicobacter ganmani]|uniref:polysaccharide pyruvyl transferase family protein n=1 Tax=Helicobacter ganmani TaxID=60246 RepID=UPI003A855557
MGGGGYMSYNQANSLTATTFNCDSKLWEKVEKPLFIVSMGLNFFHDEKLDIPQISTANKESFLRFWKVLFTNDKIHINLRNDGSTQVIEREFGKEFLKNTHKTLDNGFFFKSSFKSKFLDKKYLAINTISREPHLTLQEWQNFKNSLVRIVEYAINTLKLHIIFVPHIPLDLEAICEILSLTNERYKRENISVAPLLQGEFGAHFIASIYRDSAFSIVSRFHASIACFVENAKVIGLSHSYVNRMKALYESVNLADCFVEAKENFEQNIFALLESYPQKHADFQNQQMQTLEIYQDLFKNFN